jgi:predicted 3-demethylubiquinone-9 3-methyltransferase (glyoxalase superfamily)
VTLARLRIVPCLWFDGQAQEAANHYVAIFPNSRIARVSHYGEVEQEVSGQQPGTVLTVAFELDGQPFTALNGTPAFRFSEAVSLQVMCETQDEVDYYWERLGAGGDEQAQQCGWLKDRYGLSWQVVPRIVTQIVGEAGSAPSQRAMAALLQMKKLDIARLQRAYAGG